MSMIKCVCGFWMEIVGEARGLILLQCHDCKRVTLVAAEDSPSPIENHHER